MIVALKFVAIFCGAEYLQFAVNASFAGCLVIK
jgi:hypothetical protein